MILSRSAMSRLSVFRLSRFGPLNLAQNNAREKGARAMMINKVRTNKKYPFKQMSPGETFKLNDLHVRDAQKAAYYYRSLCKRPISIVISKQDDGYYCRRVA
jgi:hypothetical protein